MLTPDQIKQLPADARKEYLKMALLLQDKKKEQKVKLLICHHVILNQNLLLTICPPG